MLGDSLRRRHGVPQPGAEKPERRRKPARGDGWRDWSFTWRRWLVAAVAVLMGSFITGYLLSTQVLFPPPETAGTGVPVPDLYGETRDRAEATLETLGLGLGEVREIKSMSTDSGRVMAQDPLPGQQLRPGATVSLGVSAGRPELRVPPLVGLGEATARELLETVGFDVAVQQVRSAGFEAGVVTRADPTEGTPQRLPTVVTLVVSTGAPADTVPESPPERRFR